MGAPGRVAGPGRGARRARGSTQDSCAVTPGHGAEIRPTAVVFQDPLKGTSTQAESHMWPSADARLLRPPRPALSRWPPRSPLERSPLGVDERAGLRRHLRPRGRLRRRAPLRARLRRSARPARTRRLQRTGTAWRVGLGDHLATTDRSPTAPLAHRPRPLLRPAAVLGRRLGRGPRLLLPAARSSSWPRSSSCGCGPAPRLGVATRCVAAAWPTSRPMPAPGFALDCPGIRRGPRGQ